MTFLKKTLWCNIFLIMLSMMMPIVPSHAEISRKTPSLDGSVTAGPYYNPASKSYFELLRLPSSEKQNWQVASNAAQKRFYKNTKGRLAVVKDIATHQFITRNFRGPNIWIGLQYACGSKTLTWVDGTKITESSFTAWAPQWARTSVRCGGKGYMPVSYTTSQATGISARWQASGPEKFFSLYLVEFPTNGE
ncbi:hypothetical protein MNBD_ALPHA03-135 [hydrothermal vent metagenome]|uniref:C-type lectin domain-containing protein n=1 Tax=hydrothermal vent metagenome TaxID=652676 RepID=A0A3B1B4F9_9ZZZZ